MTNRDLRMTPSVARTVPALLSEMASRYPHHEFLVDGARRLTYAEFRAEVDTCAKGLIELGIQPGENVAILMGNQAEWLIADFAIIAVGATMVSLNTWATARELEYMLRHCEASALVMSDEFAGNDYVEILDQLSASNRVPQLRHIIRTQAGPRALLRSISWAHLLLAWSCTNSSARSVTAPRSACSNRWTSWLALLRWCRDLAVISSATTVSSHPTPATVHGSWRRAMSVRQAQMRSPRLRAPAALR